MIGSLQFFGYYTPNMQKVKTTWQLILPDLNAKLGGYKESPKALAEQCGINYFAARRFLTEGIKNRNKNAEKVCSFFGIELVKTEKVQPELLEDLKNLVTSVWDGSVPHAELIAELIKSTKPFRVTERK
ncbi:hypothetical protein [uncultured Oxalicibacterium sp.]|uniref:hypothetical protein n=1 Tax=uncultured Oxalicibacterium sp. TaxID=1168540 RepID=UPI0025D822AB|nr:hypothetical protein [uncultured Oxalicibacterium sp.]